MARRQICELYPPAGEKWVGTHENGVVLLARETREGRIDLAAGARSEDLDVQPHGAGRRFHVAHRRLSSGPGWVDEHGNPFGRGHQFAQEFQPLRPSSAVKMLTPVRLPPGRARLATSPSLTGSSAATKTMGIVAVAAFAARAAFAIVTITAT